MDRTTLVQLLKILLEEELTEKTMLLTFREAGLPTSSKGLVVRFTDGSEFFITVVKSKTPKEDEKDEGEKSKASKILEKENDSSKITGKKFIPFDRQKLYI